MKAICVDDERILMEDTVAMCLELPEIDEARGFVRPEDALEWLDHNAADLALLDIDMPGMNGIQLAAAIKANHPDMAILFLTGYAQYAVDAFAVRASGYLLKPVTKEALAADVAYALGGKKTQQTGRVVVQTFGSFDVFVDRKPISFKMAKCKELLAYLVDRQGSGVSRAERSAVLYRYSQMTGGGFSEAWGFEPNFTDFDHVADWAYEAVCWMTMNGILQGTENHMLLPQETATRAQVATILMRLSAQKQQDHPWRTGRIRKDDAQRDDRKKNTRRSSALRASFRICRFFRHRQPHRLPQLYQTINQKRKE